MKSALLILTALCALATARAETVKLTILQAYQAKTALDRLDDSYTHVIKQPGPEGQEAPPPRVVTTPYDFATPVRIAIYRNQKALRSECESFDKARAAIVKKIWGDRQPNEAKDTDEMARFRTEINALGETVVKVEVTRLKPEQLLAAGNPIPAQVLIDLGPVLIDP